MNSIPPRNSTAHWRQVDAAHHLHPFTDHKELAEAGRTLLSIYDSSHQA